MNTGRRRIGKTGKPRVLMAFWKGFIFVALRIINTMPLPKIAGGPLQNLRGRGWNSVSVDSVQRGKNSFCL